MRKLVITGMAIAMLAVPAASMASSFNGAQATANNPTSKDGIGFCVSAGQANYQAAGYTTGDDRSVRKGGTNDLIASARTGCDAALQAWYGSLPAPIAVTS
jgi:hypothetical protein